MEEKKDDKGFIIGARIIVTAGKHKGQHGTIKYHGSVEGQFGILYGVELDVIKGLTIET